MTTATQTEPAYIVRYLDTSGRRYSWESHGTCADAVASAQGIASEVWVVRAWIVQDGREIFSVAGDGA